MTVVPVANSGGDKMLNDALLCILSCAGVLSRFADVDTDGYMLICVWHKLCCNQIKLWKSCYLSRVILCL